VFFCVPIYYTPFLYLDNEDDEYKPSLLLCSFYSLSMPLCDSGVSSILVMHAHPILLLRKSPFLDQESSHVKDISTSQPGSPLEHIHLLLSLLTILPLPLLLLPQPIPPLIKPTPPTPIKAPKTPRHNPIHGAVLRNCFRSNQMMM
jgi:hypothetical protein